MKHLRKFQDKLGAVGKAALQITGGREWKNRFLTYLEVKSNINW